MTGRELTNKERMALRVLDLAKAQVLAGNHFLSAAVGRLKVQVGLLLLPLATDGYSLAIDVNLLCEQFKLDQKASQYDLLHTVLHCVFLHPYISPNLNADLWNLACDIVAEKNVREICGGRSGQRGSQIDSALSTVIGGIKGTVTAEKIYHALCAGEWSDKLEEWSLLFLADDHSPWYVWQQRPEAPDQESSDSPDGADDSQDSSNSGGQDQRQQQQDTSSQGDDKEGSESSSDSDGSESQVHICV